MSSERPPDAFLSYTRFDDQNDGGAISEFCKRLADAVRAVSGEPFEIFQDVDGIGIGERWRGKLDQMLHEARFFIPIVTPSYFTSKACRDEFEKFLRAEADRQRDDLVLPIYYIESDVLEDNERRAGDPLAKVIHERQRQDWRQLRFEAFEAREVRKALEHLAREIVHARRRAMPARPHVVRKEAATTRQPPEPATPRAQGSAGRKPEPLGLFLRNPIIVAAIIGAMGAVAAALSPWLLEQLSDGTRKDVQEAQELPQAKRVEAMSPEGTTKSAPVATLHTASAQTVNEAVVYIECSAEGRPTSRGTGVLVSAQGHVLTARHVMPAGYACKGAISNPTLPLRHLQRDPRTADVDATLLRFVPVPGEVFPWLKPCKLSEALKGQAIVVTGFPGGSSTIGQPSRRQGVLLTTIPNEQGILATNALIASGMSGGAATLQGTTNLIGIVAGAEFDPVTGQPIRYGVLAAELLGPAFGLTTAQCLG